MVEAYFEIKRKDGAGRLGLLSVNGKIVETPALMPVYNISKPVVSVQELVGEFGVSALMTNAYMLLKNPELKEEVLERGIHELIGFDGVIATDSGSYQLMVYGAVETTNRDIIKFQEDIGSDIGSFLDIPTLPDAYKPRAKQQLEETIRRSREAVDAGFLVNAGIQGGVYTDLREQAARETSQVSKLVAVGGIVPLMEKYRLAELVDVIATVKKNIPNDKVVHAFGLGHPMVFGLAALLGCDLFDSAAYALYAQDDRYLTEYGTEKLAELEYMPCCCPVCSEHGLGLKNLYGMDRVKALARHNLYVSFTELRRVKQAITEGSLWELVLLRCRSHPALMKALDVLMTHSEWIAGLDPITKGTAFYYTGAESAGRSEVLNARARIGRVECDNTIRLMPFGDVPAGIMDIYPFGTILDDAVNMPVVRDLAKVRALMDYQFGKGAGELIPDSVRIKRSRKTRRMRWIYEGKDMLASVRASDHFIIPHEKLALRLREKFNAPRLRVVLTDEPEAVEFVRQGKSVMCKFVESVDPELRCGDECIVVDKDDEFVRTGTLALSPSEIMDFTRGAAVKTR
ncbi:MAG: tRNA guanosine(15) transglycosylase TgtA [Candidatus Altiarchaeota archaeon]